MPFPGGPAGPAEFETTLGGVGNKLPSDDYEVWIIMTITSAGNQTTYKCTPVMSVTIAQGQGTHNSVGSITLSVTDNQTGVIQANGSWTKPQGWDFDGNPQYYIIPAGGGIMDVRSVTIPVFPPGNAGTYTINVPAPKNTYKLIVISSMVNVNGGYSRISSTWKSATVK